MKTNKYIGMIQPKISKNQDNEELPTLHRIGCLGKITSFKETDDITNWFNDFNHADNSFKPKKLQGLGPYIVSEWEPSQYITLTRKSSWWGSEDTSVYNKSYPEKIIFKVKKINKVLLVVYIKI